jgi:hypothetical protein
MNFTSQQELDTHYAGKHSKQPGQGQGEQQGQRPNQG